MCEDVSVLNRFDTGSDHRLIRATITINTRLERKKLTNRNNHQAMVELKQKERKFQEAIRRKVEPVEAMWETELNELSARITGSLIVATKKLCTGRKRIKRISPQTEDLIEQRKHTNRDSQVYAELNKEIKKHIRKDIRAHNNQIIQETIEDNMNMKVMRSKMSREKMRISKMRNERGDIVTGKQDIVEVVQSFYSHLYRSSVPRSVHVEEHRNTKIMNVGSEEMPEIDTDEMKVALRHMRNKRLRERIE